MNIGKIEKGIPLQRVEMTCYPFADMQVNDSFTISSDDSRTPMPQWKASSLVSYANKRFEHRRRFASRRVGKSSYRIWRVK